MYGLYNKGRLVNWTESFSNSSIEFNLLAQGYVKVTKQEDLERIKSERNNLISKLQRDIDWQKP